jgi:hypothetical protein
MGYGLDAGVPDWSETVPEWSEGVPDWSLSELRCAQDEDNAGLRTWPVSQERVALPQMQ